MENLLPLFEKAEAIGKMTKEIQQEIFHNLAARYSCFPLIGGKGENAKHPKQQFAF